MKSTFSRTGWAVFSAFCIAGLAPLTAHAQTWPTGPVRLIAPFPPGGPVDALTRYLGNKLSAALEQPVVVENVPGAAGGIAMQRLARAAPDGNTIAFAHVGSLTINPHIYPTLGYDPVNDFAPIALVNEYENVLVANPNEPYKTLGELLAAAKARPDAITYGSAGNGASNHLSTELLSSMTGAKFNHIPYKGSAPALIDVMGGNVDFMFDIIITSKQHIEAGKLRALATTGRSRSSELPEVPTVSEIVPGYEVVGWGAIIAPKGTPDAIVQRVSSELEKIVNSDESAELFKRQGFTQAYGTPQQLSELIKSDLARWGETVKSSGAQAQ